MVSSKSPYDCVDKDLIPIKGHPFLNIDQDPTHELKSNYNGIVFKHRETDICFEQTPKQRHNKTRVLVLPLAATGNMSGGLLSFLVEHFPDLQNQILSQIAELTRSTIRKYDQGKMEIEVQDTEETEQLFRDPVKGVVGKAFLTRTMTSKRLPEEALNSGIFREHRLRGEQCIVACIVTTLRPGQNMDSAVQTLDNTQRGFEDLLKKVAGLEHVQLHMCQLNAGSISWFRWTLPVLGLADIPEKFRYGLHIYVYVTNYNPPSGANDTRLGSLSAELNDKKMLCTGQAAECLQRYLIYATGVEASDGRTGIKYLFDSLAEQLEKACGYDVFDQKLVDEETRELKQLKEQKEKHGENYFETLYKELDDAKKLEREAMRARLGHPSEEPV